MAEQSAPSIDACRKWSPAWGLTPEGRAQGPHEDAHRSASGMYLARDMLQMQLVEIDRRRGRPLHRDYSVTSGAPDDARPTFKELWRWRGRNYPHLTNIWEMDNGQLGDGEIAGAIRKRHSPNSAQHQVTHGR